MATADANGTVQLWDANTRQPLLRLNQHTGWVSALRFSSDSQILASAGDDHTIRLWNI